MLREKKKPGPRVGSGGKLEQMYVSLTKKEVEFLDELAARKGVSRSRLIRNAVRSHYDFRRTW